MQVGLDFGDPLPVGRPAELLRRGAAVDGQRRTAGGLDGLGHLDGVDRLPGPTQADLGRHRHRVAGLDHSGQNRAHAIRIPQQVGAALGLLGDLADRAAEVHVDHADPELLDQPSADGGQHLRIVVPDLYRQRPGFVPDPPKSAGEAVTAGVDLQEAPRADHLGCQESGPA